MPDKEKNASTSQALLKHNVLIVWKPEYDLGITIIDEQHRGIVATINSLHFGMRHNYVRDMLTPIINMIFDYTHIHFRLEQDFILKNNFPGARDHQELHAQLTAKLHNIGKKTMLDKDPYQFLDFLKEWWINHICNEDLLFKHYLVSREVVF